MRRLAGLGQLITSPFLKNEIKMFLSAFPPPFPSRQILVAVLRTAQLERRRTRGGTERV